MNGLTLVTGATGFIGRALVARLRRDGVALRCLVRDRERAQASGLAPAEIAEGALEDDSALRRAVTGVGAVVHLAGATRALDAAAFLRANAEGSARLAAAAAGCAPGLRFVHVSSLAAAGPSVDGRGTDAAPAACRPRSWYGRSKLGGERGVLAHANRIDWCVVRPPIVYGPGDDATALLVAQALGWLAPVPLGRRPLSLVHVDDLVAALVRALTARGVTGFFPIDGPERADTTSLPQRIAAAAGRRARPLPVPMPLAFVAGFAVDLVHRLRGVPGYFGVDKLRDVASVGWVAAPGPARERLGFAAQIGIDQGFRSTFAANRAAGAGSVTRGGG